MIFRIILRRNQKRKLEVDLARAAVGNAARGRYDAALNRYKKNLSFLFWFYFSNFKSSPAGRACCFLRSEFVREFLANGLGG